MTGTNRARQARQRAKRLGLRMSQRGHVITLHDGQGLAVASGGLGAIETYLAARAVHRRAVRRSGHHQRRAQTAQPAHQVSRVMVSAAWSVIAATPMSVRGGSVP
ncbi:hypothetical protein [Mycobacterium conspicuum]|uniref:Uncharacterized protein n=1 Tax=Mycobacterium conspicuum TaxID=44010 RepID=A0A1X1T3R6_9MYCO|nr:hypothetical protein [Mycobacterium conspicuum]ORV39203.1 hypothetical protein AWC00_19050 [Mycobacterium conspicuum]BBZ39298.1 hypothetical protein MCNS_23610 [Mycobacterium conspicuum]